MTTTSLVCEKIKYKICARGKSIEEINFFFIFTHFLFIFFRFRMITMMIKNFSNPEIDLKQTEFLFIFPIRNRNRIPETFRLPYSSEAKINKCGMNDESLGFRPTTIPSSFNKSNYFPLMRRRN